MRFIWIAEIFIAFAVLFIGLAISAYGQNKFTQCFNWGSFGIVFLAVFIILHFRNEIVYKENLAKDSRIIDRTEETIYLEKNNRTTKKESQKVEPLSQFYATADEKIFPKKTIKKPLDNSKLKKIRIGGLIVEGLRNNLIPNDWFQDQKYASLGAVIKNSRIEAFSVPEYIFRVEPNKKLNIDINAPPLAQRNDYTFSFLYYTDNIDFPHVKLQCSISDGNEKVTKMFSYKNEDIFIMRTPEGLIVFRPFISHKFSSQPQNIVASINLENTTTKEFTFIFCFPMIEQGLFPSSPIIGNYRDGETVSWEGADKAFNKKKGTLSFFFQPFWGANDLTAGISPYLFYWVTDDLNHGIKIFADSNDNGKIKVESISDGSKSYIVSEISPLKGEAYSVCLRWNNNLADLIINGKNVYSAKLVMPSCKALSPKFYLGSSPISKEYGAFAVFRDFKFYSDWLSDRIIKSEIYRSFPQIFPEFEGYARELVKAQKTKQ